MLESSFQVARVAGIRIGIHYTWLIVFFLMNTSLFYVFKQTLLDWSDFAAVVTALVTSTLFFISIILHELGHSIVAIRNGIDVKSITLFIFGGVAQTERESDTAAIEFKVAIAGPAVSMFLAGLFILLRDWLGHPGAPLYESLDWLASINLIVAIFNLIPGFPLDGGRVFRALVWAFTGDETKGMRWAVAGGRIVAYGLMGIGMFSAIRTGNILNGIWMIGIGWFLLSAAEASGRAFTQGRIMKRLDLGGLINFDVPRVAADVTVDNWVQQQVLPRYQRSALVEDDGQVIGLVSLSDTGKISQQEWNQKRVSEIMTPADKLHYVSAADSVDDVLSHMQIYNINQVPVVENSQVVGWIDREQLLRALSVYVESKRI